VLLAINQLAFSQSTGIGYQNEVIENYAKDTLNYDFIENLSVIDTTVSKAEVEGFENRLNTLISSFPEKQESDRKEKKRIKKIYDITHDELFVKYEDIAFFPEIFDTGYYNCVTATAVYAHIFDQLSIPYLIKDDPGHVYLIAYPDSYNIYLETTVPSEYGFSNVGEGEIEKIVDDLVGMKLIAKTEVEEKGYKSVYQDFFFGDGFVDKSALVGMQYYNKAYTYFTEENYPEALKNINLAKTYYHKKTVDYMKVAISFNLLGEIEFSSEEDIDLFADVLNNLEYEKDFDKEDLEYFYYKLINEREDDLAYLEKAASSFNDLRDKAVRAIIQENLYEHLLIESMKVEDIDKGIAYANKVLEINEENKRARFAITYGYRRKIAILPVSLSSIDQIEAYEKDYSFLAEDPNIKSFKAFIYIRLIAGAYATRDYASGEDYIENLESIIDSSADNLLVNYEDIARAYLAAGTYYYRFNKFEKAKKYLEKGQNFSPDNSELKKYLRWTLEEM